VSDCLRTAAALLFAAALAAAPNGGRVEYLGGTLAEIKAKANAQLLFTDRDAMLFCIRGETLRIPYARINVLEYGQRVDRRYIEAIVISPLLLLSKSRKHFLTLGFRDAQGGQQSLVFRVDKGDVRAVLASLEARTGRKVEYLDEQARKSGKG
jgi:hypothetical protein